MRLMLLLTAGRLFNAACAHWYPIVKELHHFFVAIARTVVNHDGSGGTTLHPTVWSIAACPKRRLVHRAVRDMAWLPGPESLFGPRSGALPKGLRLLRMMSVHGLFRSGC